MYFTDPESRTFFNVMMSGASLIPFVPPVSAAKTALDPNPSRTCGRMCLSVIKARVENIDAGDIDPTAIDQRFPGEIAN